MASEMIDGIYYSTGDYYPTLIENFKKCGHVVHFFETQGNCKTFVKQMDKRMEDDRKYCSQIMKVQSKSKVGITVPSSYVYEVHYFLPKTNEDLLFVLKKERQGGFA